MFYLQCFLHPGPLLQSTLLESGHLILQACQHTLPLLLGTFWRLPGQVLEDPKTMLQELEESLITEMKHQTKYFIVVCF